MAEAPAPVHLSEPAKTVLIKATGERIAYRWPAGDVVAQDDDEAAALEQLQAILARRIPPSDSSVADVKAWVGDDPARAAAALEAERGRDGGPRTSLEPWLARLAEPDDGASVEVDQDQEG